MTVRLYAYREGGSCGVTASSLVKHSRGKLEWGAVGEEPEPPCVLFGVLKTVREFSEVYRGHPVYTMWEGAVLRPEDVMALGRCGPLAVPSTYCRSTFRHHQFDPVVIPHGVDADVWKPPPRRDHGLVSISWVSIRKNLGDTARAYIEAFREPRPDLCIKVFTDNLHGPGMRGLVKDLPGNVLWEHWSEEVLADFVARHRALVSTSLSEGFGKPALEAMACGTVPIVPDFGGFKDFVNEDTAFLVPTTPFIDWTPPYPIDPSMGWQRPLVSEVARAMRLALEDESLMQEKSEKARRRALDFTWERAADDLVAFAEGAARR